MNRILLVILCAIAFTTRTTAQSAGLNNTFIVLTINNGLNLYYDLNANTSNYDFQGQTLGTFCQGSNDLVLKGGENNVWKCGGCDVTGTALAYRIYATGTTPGAFIINPLNYFSGGNNGCGGADQRWEKLNYNVNLLSGLAAGSYTIEVYSEAYSSCYGTVYASNGGANYKATFNVSATSVGGTVAPGQAVCSGSMPGNLVLNGYTGSVVKWQRSTVADFSANVTDIATTSATLPGTTIGTLTQTTYFRAVVQSGSCSTANSGIATITVSPVSAGGTLTVGSYNGCSLNNSGTITLSGYTGNVVKWQSSTSADFSTALTDISNTTPSYNFTNVQATTYYRALVQSGYCGVAYSAPAAVTLVANTWTGNANTTNWYDSANWSCATVPSESTTVVIAAAAYQPVISGSVMAHAGSITVAADATLQIAGNGTLKVENAIHTAGTFIVQNNASLIQVNDVDNTGNAIVYRNSNTLFRLDYTMWSAPVEGQQLKAFSPNTLSNRFYTYSYNYDAGMSTPGYAEQFWHADWLTNFVPGTSYMIRMPNFIDGNQPYAGTSNTTPVVFSGAFTGVLNNGDVTIPVSVSDLSTPGSLSRAGHYVGVGNPYASPISVAQFFSQNAAVLAPGNGLYFWRKKNETGTNSYCVLTMAGYTANAATGGDINPGNGGGAMYYPAPQSGTFNPDWVIASGQGFLVRIDPAAQASASVKFTNTMRMAAPALGQPFFKTTTNNNAATPSRLWVNLSGAGNTFAQATVAYIDGATTGLDYGYDGRLLNNEGLIKLYSIAAQSSLAVQARPAFSTDDVVVMGFTANVAGQYTITIDHADGILSGSQDVYLVDKHTGITANLKQNAYTFTSDAGTFETRFEIRYVAQGSLGTPVQTLENMVMVYLDNGVININSGQAEMTDITVYDIRGKKLFEKDKINSTQFSIPVLTAASEVLIIEVTTQQGKVAKRIIY